MRLKISLFVVIAAALLIGQAVLAQQATPTQTAQNTVELLGPVQSINADGSIVVNGLTITITTAEISVPLSAGQVVRVEGTLLPDGRIAAREVRAPRDRDLRDDDEIELIGIVESFDGFTLVVNGLSISVRGAEINAPIVVGQPIKVHGSFDASGSLIARETDDDIFDDNSDDDSGTPSPAATPGATPGANTSTRRTGEFEMVGTLQQVGDGFVVVNGQTISIVGAEIKNTLVAGTLVKLHVRNQNGQLVAREIENARTRSRSGDDNDDRSGGGAWNTTYTVRPGDTLSRIAARTGTTVEELALRNNITDIRVIVAGMQLIVPRPLSDDDDNRGRGGSGSSMGRGSGGSDDSGRSGSGSNNSGRGSGSSDDDDDDNGGSSGRSSGRGSGSSDDDDDD